ncbi:ferric/cupric-chelate reductase, partial [Chytridiales sp. JEL 0842]
MALPASAFGSFLSFILVVLLVFSALAYYLLDPVSTLNDGLTRADLGWLLFYFGSIFLSTLGIAAQEVFGNAPLLATSTPRSDEPTPDIFRKQDKSKFGQVVVVADVQTPSLSTPKRPHFSLWTPRYQLLSQAFSLGDLIFLAILFVLHVIWITVPINAKYNLPQGAHGAIKRQDPFSHLNAWAAVSAIPAMWDMGLSLVLVVRRKALLKMATGLEFPTAIKFHILLGWVSFVLISFHCIGYFIVYGATNTIILNIFSMSFGGYFNFTGFIGWAAQAIFFVTSLEPIRRRYYQVFIWSHQLYILFIIMSLLHFWQTFYFVLPAVALLLIDRWMPSSFGNTADTVFDTEHSVYASSVTADIVKIVLESRFDCSQGLIAPGDWVKIKVPDVSTTEWHPYTIANYGPETPNQAVFYIKVQGPDSWSSKLKQIVDTKVSTTPIVPLEAHFDGIFGHDGFGAEYIDFNRVFVLAGGLGVSPVLPMLRQMVANAYSKGRQNFFVHFVWVVRDVSTALVISEWLELVQKSA